MFDANDIRLDNWEDIKVVKKKPIEIHAVQMNLPEGFFVDTLEGKMTGQPGDWLMFGVNGEKYPCKSEIFDKSYDIVRDKGV